jgi:hypothetical protein
MLQAADRCCRSDRFDPGEIVGRNHHALVLLRQEESFLARVVDGVVSIDPADNADTGRVFSMRDLPGGGVLIGAVKGLFLARVANGTVSIDHAGNADTALRL